MHLTEFQVENYRSFRHRQKIGLRPLTLFFGWNSGGKSALVRFLPLITESVRARKVLELGGRVARGSTWRDIVCRQSRNPKLSFDLLWRSGSYEATEAWTIDGDLHGRFVVIDSFRYRDTVGAAPYEWIAADHSGQELTTLSPSVRPDSAMPVDKLHLRQERLSDGIQWITGIRNPPPRIHPFSGTRPKRLRPDGSNAIDFVLFDQHRQSESPLYSELRSFFEPLNLQLETDSVAESIFRLTISPLNSLAVKVNLLDTGEGYAQVLPVLVALARSRQEGTVTCLEQPELHLHTHAQTVLADRLIAAAKAGPDNENQSSILVETHSEVILASVQLAIARGDISPDRVRVYWVEAESDGTSVVRPVDFDALGRPTSPVMVGAFAQAVRLGDELIKVRRGKRV